LAADCPLAGDCGLCGDCKVPPLYTKSHLDY
jgi:hypothetical protein